MKNIFNKFNAIDLIIIFAIIIALFVGGLTTKKVRQTADKQIEATSKITFQVYLRGVTSTRPEFPIKANNKTFLTIRNVPYTELDVLKVVSETRKTAIPSLKTKDSYILIKDPAQPAMYDAIITIEDTAKITKDGAVVGGNKIKMGLPVTLEGDCYKYNGIISDVRVETDVDEEAKNDCSTNLLG